MKVCPQCGYVDDFRWRATTWHATQGNECCRLSDLEELDPVLATRLKNSREIVDKHYAYRITKTGIWVVRRWIEIFKIQGWKDIPAESRKPGSVTYG